MIKVLSAFETIRLKAVDNFRPEALQGYGLLGSI
jgi:hypothetical protein